MSMVVAGMEWNKTSSEPLSIDSFIELQHQVFCYYELHGTWVSGW